MSKQRTAEEARNPTVTVGGKEFPIGTVTLFQIISLKNIVMELVLSARARNAQRQAERQQAMLTRMEPQFATIRSDIAQRMGVDEEDIDQAAYIAEIAGAMSRAIEEEGGTDGFSGQTGQILMVLDMLNEDQLLQFLTLMLNRHPDHCVAQHWVAEHFNLEWVLEALAIFLERNNIPSLVKNLQRLGMAVSTQMSLTQNPPM